MVSASIINGEQLLVADLRIRLFQHAAENPNQFVRAVCLLIAIHTRAFDVFIRYRVQLMRRRIALHAVQAVAGFQRAEHMFRQSAQNAKQPHADKQAQFAVPVRYTLFASAIQFVRLCRQFPLQNIRAKFNPPVRPALNHIRCV